MLFKKDRVKSGKIIMDIEDMDTGDLIYASKHSPEAYDNLAAEYEKYEYYTPKKSVAFRSMDKPETAQQPKLQGCTFVNKMLFHIDATYKGYLLYDVEGELFAGPYGKWAERVKDIFVVDVNIILPPANEEWDLPFISMSGQSALNEVEEVLLVPCESFESQVSGDLLIYQNLDWKMAFGMKSKSGVLPVMI